MKVGFDCSSVLLISASVGRPVLRQETYSAERAENVSVFIFENAVKNFGEALFVFLVEAFPTLRIVFPFQFPIEFLGSVEELLGFLCGPCSVPSHFFIAFHQLWSVLRKARTKSRLVRRSSFL